MNIGENIIYLRERKGWTQRELANMVGINTSVMNRIESGERPTKDEEILKLAKILNTSTDYLLDHSINKEKEADLLEIIDSFEQRLKIARKAKKFTQDDLAKRIQTTKSTISNYENGYSTPSNDMLIVLARTLECSADYLLGIEKAPKKQELGWESFSTDSSLAKWYKELPNAKATDLRKLRKMWEILKDNGEI